MAVRALYAGAVVLAAHAAVFVWGMAALLLAVAETPGGRLAALCFLCLPPGVMLVLLRPLLPSARTRRWTVASAVLVAGAAGAYGLAWAQAPRGEAPAGAPLQSVWLDGDRFRPWALANVVPEIDQFTLGSYLVPFLDPYIDGAQAARIRETFQHIYRPMRQDPAFVALGSGMPMAYSDLPGLPRDRGHLYVYTPASRPEGALPVVLFLHGSAGPFKGYQWVWAELAEAEGWAVVSPSFGFGHWGDPAGVDTVRRALDYIAANPRLDADRVVLAGLSNGGLGVTRAAAGIPGAFQGLVYLSPVIEAGWMPDVARAHRGPVTVITGADDRRVPLSWVRGAVEVLEAQGADVRLEVAPGEDHFLFFSDPGWCRERVGEAILGPR
ncbi:MAG: hypothetical protein H6739_27305 [Alphaproteobacteria bacterium]|nr:hypothetical protein [Alphaproteobacteria bacterium]